MVLTYDKGKPDFLLQITFLCIPLVVCPSEIIASESSSSLIQHGCIMFSDDIYARYLVTINVYWMSPRSTVVSTGFSHSGLKYTLQRVPASFFFFQANCSAK